MTFRRFAESQTCHSDPTEMAELRIHLEDLKAEAGDANAQYRLGRKYAIGVGVKTDFKEAARWYRKAAEQGDAKAQSYLGAMYGIGRGVKEDSKESLKWYQKAAGQGDIDAGFAIGLIYGEGHGVPKDTEEYHGPGTPWSIISEGKGLSGSVEVV